MKTTIENSKKLKEFAKTNKIISINGIDFNSLSPELTNKHSQYYDISTQSYKSLYAPFIIEF